ncbi:CehA/McbA family metallohydrolase [Streptomyces sp. NPDC058221]|uniref:CehA/McbA family metallohydrolase n=1 Tax=Streptomyces sp. NPDC058221 TaxID=3346388 RepID=UPI0036DFD6C1
MSRPQASSPPAADRGRNWYRGDCHVHSAVSNGGELTPERLAADARAAGLDFLAATEHNTTATHGVWSRQADDGLLVILGLEVTTLTGHWLALGIPPGETPLDRHYGVRDDVIDRQLDAVHRLGGLCVAAHPHAPYPSGTFMYPFRGFDAVEVWNGPWRSDVPWQADNEAALAEWGRGLAAGIHGGRWLPALGNSDAHLEDQIGTPHSVVPADGLNAGAVLDGIRAGRSWLAESAAVELSFTVSAGGRSAGIGERLEAGGGRAVARAEVRGVPSGTVGFHTERGRVHHEALPGSGAGVVECSLGSDDSAFVRVEVRRPGGAMAALSNPVVLV